MSRETGATVRADEDAAIAANYEFYAAFRARDDARMEAVWAKSAGVSCIHPGWNPLLGRNAVLESWRNIMAGPESPDIVCTGANASVYGPIAVVICTEHLSGDELVATNVFVREADGFRLVHHQAGPGAPVLRQPPTDALN